jgi:hypothetical protein
MEKGKTILSKTESYKRTSLTVTVEEDETWLEVTMSVNCIILFIQKVNKELVKKSMYPFHDYEPPDNSL